MDVTRRMEDTNLDATKPLTLSRSRPTALWMHLAFILTGLGTLLLGPILPLLSHQWRLADAQSGLLFSAQFYGSFLGGVTVSKRLHRSMIAGMASAGVGFALFAFAASLLPACIGLFLGGYGLGQLITSINILGARRATEHRGSALAFLNFSWSFGAMLSPLLAASLVPRIGLALALKLFAVAFLTLLLVLLAQLRGPNQLQSSAPEPVSTVEPSGNNLGTRLFLVYCTLLILYGGLETCLGGWLATFSLRYATHSLRLSEWVVVLLLAGLTAGRAASSSLLRHVSERLLLRLSLALAALLTAALALASSAPVIACLAVLLGMSLAPFFPATFALLIAERPSARQAGIVVAVSALGAAALPWLMGVVSTRTGSLQLALLLPFAAAVILLLVSLVLPAGRTHDAPAFPPAPGV